MNGILNLKDVSVHFAGLKALTDVSLSANAGEVTAVIGPNGAGKTTLFNVISGYVQPTAGEIYFKGEPVHGLTPHEVSARGCAARSRTAGCSAR